MLENLQSAPRSARLRVLVAAVALPAMAPLGLYVVHLAFAHVWGVYGKWPWADLPMHFAGGGVMAFFLARLFRAVFGDGVSARPAFALLVCSSTVTVAVLWEFSEFLSDRYLGTHAQGGLSDTLGDLFFGMLAALVFVLASLARKRGP